ncbi:hypothetical protein NL676_031582 [Syzygium grande]|nr:hypothetical protein NL676_031582 [Syzygium grande]
MELFGRPFGLLSIQSNPRTRNTWTVSTDTHLTPYPRHAIAPHSNFSLPVLPPPPSLLPRYAISFLRSPPLPPPFRYSSGVASRRRS